MTHTPGPWTLATAHDARVILVNDRNGNAVGELVYSDTRNPADARLIAAAPDLLAALRTMMREYECLRYEQPERWPEAAKAARAAIARATG